MSPTAKQNESSEPDTGGAITYVDMGDYTIEIDNRGPVQQRRRLPKSSRGLGVSAATRKELEERIEAEIVAPAKLAEEQSDPAALLPPAEDEDAVAKREKKAREQLDAAKEQQDEAQEEAQAEVRGESSSSKSSSSS